MTNKRVMVIVVAGYLAAWIGTQVGGASYVREIGMKAVPAIDSMVEAEGGGRRRVAAPVYWSRAVAYAPLIVGLDYGWIGNEPLQGYGAHRLYFWLPGRAFQIWEYSHWMS